MNDVILRRFWLEDQNGTSVPLNGERGIWLINPTGLGISTSSSFVDYKNGFFTPVNDHKDPQQTVAGDLYFISNTDPYLKYRGFVDWISNIETLYLVYSPSHKQYRRKAKLNYITKTELLTQECLKCPVAIYGLTPWFYTERIDNPTIDSFTDATFRVDVGRVNVNRLAERPYPTISWDIYPSGQLPAAFRIKYGGSLINPSVKIRGLNSGTIYGAVQLIDVSFGPGYTFEYSTDYGDSYIRAKTYNGSYIDMLNYVEDLSTDLFPKLPLNEPCTIEFTSAQQISSTVELEVITYNRGV